MSLNEWSESIVIGELLDEPALGEDLKTLVTRAEKKVSGLHVVLDMRNVTYLNSSNLAALLQLRKLLVSADGSLHLCGVGDAVWSILLMTGLDRLFKFTDDVPTALAAAQLGL